MKTLNQTTEEPLFELKQDINTPGQYIKAGERKTKQEWEQLFPSCFGLGVDDWFIDLSKTKDQFKPNQHLVNIMLSVFEKKNLNSISYRGAALECLKILQKQHKARIDKSLNDQNQTTAAYQKVIDDMKAVLIKLDPIIDHQINLTPTGEIRNQLCAINIELKTLLNV